jgi:hypothetical protein
MVALVAVLGVLAPESLVHSRGFALLAGFVAVNTVMYVSLSLAKALPRLHPRDWVPRRYARGETRSIYPDGPA